MKARTRSLNRWLLLVPIAALGFGIYYLNDQFLVTDQGTFLKSDLEARHEAARSAGENAPGPLPVIDFPLLDQARSLDLIDMELGFPESLRGLDGRRVGLVGFMAPFDDLNDMRRCMIVPSYVGCTFCSPPSLTQVVYVTQGDSSVPAAPYPFIEEPSYVSGILRLSLPGSDHEGQGQGFVYSLENAVVTPHTGEAPKRSPGHGAAAAGQTAHKQAAELAPVGMEDLVREVAELLGREPLRPIELEPVPAETFGDVIRSGLEANYPEATRAARARAFSLLGMLQEGAGWIDTLAENQLARRVAASDETGERIYLLDSVSGDLPYARLELVAGIASALTRQHFPRRGAGPGGHSGKEESKESDDARRAHEALRQGIRVMTAYRYARSQSIPTAARPPAELVVRRGLRPFAAVKLDEWQSLPGDVGPFFVDFLVGAAGPLSGIGPALSRPPSTTMELFRPRWYEDPALWRQDPVPVDFADALLETPPALTDVLGVGGLVPWLQSEFVFDVSSAKNLAGQWAGDRWAVWQFPDGASALLLEIRWQEENSAIEFCDAVIEGSGWKVLPRLAGSARVQLLRTDSPDMIDRLTAALGQAAR